MENLESEVYEAVEQLLNSVKTIAERTPYEMIRGAAHDFNQLLAKAKTAVPASEVVRDMKELGENDSAFTMMSRLAALHGAMKGARYNAARRASHERRPPSRPLYGS